ncbi:MAG: phosphoserine phosphatase [Candidatus Methanoperedens sp.]|nr:phosphoserine phosphatase [Candidatus Methanoperedens sp.]
MPESENTQDANEPQINADERRFNAPPKAEVDAPADVPADAPVGAPGEQSNEQIIEQPADNAKTHFAAPLPRLSERELKEKTNLLRQRLEQNERELKNTFRELSLHGTGGDELKVKRDALHARVKELSPKASELRKKRDEANSKIAELKSQRDMLKGRGKDFSERVGGLKKTRDELNLTARGRAETLEKAYNEELNLFLTADLPLEHEVNIFNRLNELSQRLDATKKANEIHSEISVEYDRAKEIYTDMDSLHAQIQALAQESQKYHEEMIALYNEIDMLRKEADSHHLQLTEKYKGIAPLRKKISAIKAEIPKMRDELGVYLEQMKDIQLSKDEKKNEGKREEAKEKFKKSGRVSLEEFRILVENEDIKL